MIEWLAVYDAVTDRCSYVPASMLGEDGMRHMHLRLTATRNGQHVGVRYADDYLDPLPSAQRALQMEPAGFEPATFRMQTERSTN